MKQEVLQWLERRRSAGPAPIGIEFAAHALHLVQCERRQDRTLIRAAASLPYPCSRDELLDDRRTLRRFMRAALASAPFAGRRVHSALPASDVRVVPLVIQGQRNGDEAVIKALKEKLRSDLTDDVVDYLPVRSAPDATSETNILAAVAARPVVLAHLALLERAGLEPVTLDIGPAALARLMSALQSEPYGTFLLVNFGLEKSYITAVSGRRLMLDREMAFGQSQLTGRLVETLGITDSMAVELLVQAGSERVENEAGAFGASAGATVDEVLHAQFSVLSGEVSRTLVYIASRTRGNSVRVVYLNGALAHLAYVQRRMQALFDVPVIVLDALREFTPVNSAAYDPALQANPGMALATGLALRD